MSTTCRMRIPLQMHLFHLTQMLFSCLFPAGQLKLHVKPHKNLSLDRICIPITTEKNDQFQDMDFSL